MKSAVALTIASLAMASPLPTEIPEEGTFDLITLAAQSIDDVFDLTTRAADVAIRSNSTAGVIQHPTAGNAFTGATATINLPIGKEPAGTRDGHVSTIDINVGQTAGPVTGCLVDSRPGTATIYRCYAGWFPLSTFTGAFIPIEGDTIVASVALTNSTAGTATLRNQRTGQTFTQAVAAPSAAASTTGQAATYNLRVLRTNESIPYQNFQNVPFANVLASQRTGGSVGVSGADTSDVFAPNGQQITQTSFSSASAFNIKYVGPQ